MTQVTKKILKDIYKPRPEDSKKYDFGLLTVIGGSEFYSGSPALAGMAAFRAGVDMVRVIAPKRAADIIASFTPNLAAYPLKNGYLTKEHLALLISMTESAKVVSNGKAAIVIGGGMGRSQETQEAILEFLSQVSLPVVIDADAIHALAKNPEVVSGKPFLITPHTYEFFVLTKREVYKLPEADKIKAVQEEAKRLNTTILLKGKTDIICRAPRKRSEAEDEGEALSDHDGKEVALNRTGNQFMTVGGTGDALAGICGALLARGVEPFLAAQAGAFINGLAGELASKNLGESMTATDLIDKIPDVIPRS